MSTLLNQMNSIKWRICCMGFLPKIFWSKNWIPEDAVYGWIRKIPGENRGCLLGLVECSGININYELIREGHSYFDTCFSRPRNYVLYARQEAQTFNSRKGIWSSLDSRNTFLKRLRDQGKTVYFLKNLLFRAEPKKSLNLRTAQYKGLFLRIRGSLVKIQELSRGHAPCTKVLFNFTVEKNGIFGCTGEWCWTELDTDLTSM